MLGDERLRPISPRLQMHRMLSCSIFTCFLACSTQGVLVEMAHHTGPFHQISRMEAAHLKILPSSLELSTGSVCFSGRTTYRGLSIDSVSLSRNSPWNLFSARPCLGTPQDSENGCKTDKVRIQGGGLSALSLVKYDHFSR